MLIESHSPPGNRFASSSLWGWGSGLRYFFTGSPLSFGRGRGESRGVWKPGICFACPCSPVTPLARGKRGRPWRSAPAWPWSAPLFSLAAPLQPCLPRPPLAQPPLSWLLRSGTHLLTSRRYHLCLGSCCLISVPSLVPLFPRAVVVTVWLHSAWTWRCGSNSMLAAKTLLQSLQSMGTCFFFLWSCGIFWVFIIVIIKICPADRT